MFQAALQNIFILVSFYTAKYTIKLLQKVHAYFLAPEVYVFDVTCQGGI